MDIQKIAEWLKTTIPGIIILGTLGSILAVFVLRLASRLTKGCLETAETFLKLHKRAYYLTHRFAHRRHFLDAAFIEDAAARNNTAGLLLFLVLRFVRGAIGVCLFWWACLRVSTYWHEIHFTPAEPPLALLKLLLSVICIELGALIALMDFGTLVRAYTEFVLRPFQQLKEQHKQEIAWDPKTDQLPDTDEHSESNDA